MKRHQAGITATLALVALSMTVLTSITGCAADHYIAQEKQRKEILESAYQRALEEKKMAEAKHVEKKKAKADQQAEQRRLQKEITLLENEIRRLDAKEKVLRDELLRLRRKDGGNGARKAELEREIGVQQQTIRQKQHRLDTLRSIL
uniref:Uncharacterized protein n=1 Tax=Candidatus Kentrum sp. DK TaxID=2126562 RepID=A0A450T6V1_9GAMM|nr:MAG: hypothetical protein BECKDK2373C_GA0170839_109613 [Candidatus Kentron sp. DK]